MLLYFLKKAGMLWSLPPAAEVPTLQQLDTDSVLLLGPAGNYTWALDASGGKSFAIRAAARREGRSHPIAVGSALTADGKRIGFAVRWF